jgi:transmembrane sensor
MDPKARQLEALYAQQASSWVETMRHAGPGDDRRFVAWLKESPRNVRDFLLMLSLDRALGEIDARHIERVESLIAEVEASPFTARQGTPARADRRRWRRLAALAASLLIAAGVGWAWLAHGRGAWQEYATATGEQRTFELEDGSIVYLNTHSRVRIRLAARSREVRLLRGEALFHVHHDPARPFLVATEDAVVQAVGTQFDVYRRDDGTVVSVLEGRVNVTPAAKPDPSGNAQASSGVASIPATAASRRLDASEEARVSHAGSVSIREVNNVSDTVAWRERRLIFRDQTLEQIVLEFNRYRATPIRLGSGSVGERLFTGVFDADDADSLLQVLAHDPALEVDRSGGSIIVRLR